MDDNLYRCTTCDREFNIPEDIPDAVQLTEGRTATWRFADGSTHHLRMIVRRDETKGRRRRPVEEK